MAKMLMETMSTQGLPMLYLGHTRVTHGYFEQLRLVQILGVLFHYLIERSEK